MTTQVSTATHDKYGFPLRDCTRCGGNGHHAYCEAYGTKCFGCGGTGRSRTTAGEREYRKWIEAVTAVQTTPIADVKVGELLWTSVGISGAKRWWTVTDINFNPAGAVANGEPVATTTFVITRRGATESVSYCGIPTVRINRGDAQPTPDEYVQRALAAAK